MHVHVHARHPACRSQDGVRPQLQQLQQPRQLLPAQQHRAACQPPLLVSLHLHHAHRRPTTPGLWGIWGHDLGDLLLWRMKKLGAEGPWVMFIDT